MPTDADLELTCLYCSSSLPRTALKCRWCGEFVVANGILPDDTLNGMLAQLEEAVRLVREELQRRANARRKADREITIHVGMTAAESERLLVVETLKATQGNRGEAAKLLGMGERTLYRKLKDWGYH